MAATEQRVSVLLRTPDGPTKGLPVDANVLSFSLSGAGEIDLSLWPRNLVRSLMLMSPLPGSRSLACPTRIRCLLTSG
jgi:hypothetical protein